MKNKELDHVDREILRMLQENARMSLKDIAEAEFLSSPAVSVRIDNMIEAGYIEGFHATVNPVKMGYHIKAFINLEVSPIDKEQFYPYIKACPNVVECNCVTGDYSMLLEVWFPSTHELDQFIGELPAIWTNQNTDRVFYFGRNTEGFWWMEVFMWKGAIKLIIIWIWQMSCRRGEPVCESVTVLSL